MNIAKRIISSLIFGVTFFIFGLASIVILGYIFAPLKGLQYNFHMAVMYGIHCGAYLGSVATVLAFSTSRRRLPF
ncbi:hypothetical protein ISP15_17880 [Dyella jejuensis]|uniref:Major facilitator superfamily (MFS) profile domain-containing protein n=1 Tax=Dyella jejuensis TaxID=1432009 RepID=A0ABW8JM60_9GAMM